MTVITDSNINLSDIMKYELKAYPTAIFETLENFRKADKSQLATITITSYICLYTAF